MIFERSYKLYSEQPPEQLTESLLSKLEPTPLPLEMRHERVGPRFMLTLNHPESERPFFGTLKDDQFTLSFIPHPKDFSSFQPIITGKIKPHETGSLIELTQSPHERAKHSIYLFDLMAVTPIILFLITFFQKDTLSLPLYLLPFISPFLILINHLVVGSLVLDEQKKGLKKLKKHLDLKSGK